MSNKEMLPSKKPLGRKKEEAIAALLTHPSVKEAARAVNRPVRTLYRWLIEPEFSAAYRAAQHAALTQNIGRLLQMSSPALSTMGKIMVDSNVPAASRLRAALSIYDRAVSALELEDLRARLAALEEIAKDDKKS